MKKLLLLLLLLPALAFGTTNTITGGLWSIKSILSTDTVTVNGTVSNDTADAGNYSCVRYIRPASNNKLQTETGANSVTVVNGWLDSGITSAKKYPDSIHMTGNGTFRTPGVSGAPNLLGTMVVFHGNRDTLSDGWGPSYRGIIIGAGDTVVNNGAARPSFNSFVMENYSKLTLTRGMYIQKAASGGTMYTIGTGCAFAGAGTIDIITNAAGTVSFPKFVSAVTGITAIYTAGNFSEVDSLLDSLTVGGALNIYNPTATGTFTFKTNNNPVNCGALSE
jgi:hypothetical protein